MYVLTIFKRERMVEHSYLHISFQYAVHTDDARVVHFWNNIKFSGEKLRQEILWRYIFIHDFAGQLFNLVACSVLGHTNLGIRALT